MDDHSSDGLDNTLAIDENTGLEDLLNRLAIDEDTSRTQTRKKIKGYLDQQGVFYCLVCNEHVQQRSGGKRHITKQHRVKSQELIAKYQDLKNKVENDEEEASLVDQMNFRLYKFRVACLRRMSEL